MKVAAMVLCGISAVIMAQTGAQSQPAKTGNSVKTFYLSNVGQANEATEILAELKIMLGEGSLVFLDLSQNALVVKGTPEQLDEAATLIKDLDRPKKAYRLTFTITETDAGKRIGVMHSEMVVVVGGRTTLKNGSKVPVATGSYNSSGASAQTQFTYLDVGLNIDASLDDFAGGARLKAKVEQSSLAPETSGVGAADPVVRQSVMEGVSFLTAGKPVVLGALDITGSTRHLEIEVVMEPVK